MIILLPTIDHRGIVQVPEGQTLHLDKDTAKGAGAYIVEWMIRDSNDVTLHSVKKSTEAVFENERTTRTSMEHLPGYARW